jgi:hypothetical protein
LAATDEAEDVMKDPSGMSDDELHELLKALDRRRYEVNREIVSRQRKAAEEEQRKVEGRRMLDARKYR